jgi:hypothetical protein
MVLNALFVCLHAFSLRRESPDPDPERRTPHFWGGSVTLTDTYWAVVAQVYWSWIIDTMNQKGFFNNFGGQ